MTDTMQKIKDAMHTKGIKQKEISDRTGYPPQRISRWFHGGCNPSIDHVEDLVNALGMEIKIVERKQKANKKTMYKPRHRRWGRDEK